MKRFFFLGFMGVLKIILASVIIWLRIKYSFTDWYLDVIFYLIIVSLVVDVVLMFYNNYRDLKKEKDLINEREITKKDRAEAKEIAIKNIKFRENYIRKKENAERFLNKLIQESLIKENDILSVAKTCKYYQIVIYSYSYSKILSAGERKAFTKAQMTDLKKLKRKYPEFLCDIGFIRIGTMSSTVFIANKNYLNKKLRKLPAFRKYLLIELERIRTEEWNEFLKFLKSLKRKNTHLYEKYKNSFNDDYLPINFLLTESIMNSGHLGFIRDKRIGLAPTKSNRDFSIQLLSGIKIKDIKLLKDEKIKIKDFFKKTDIEFLLDGVDTKIKKKICKNEDKIKEKFEVEYVLDFAKVNTAQFEKYFESEKLGDKKLAKIIMRCAKQYRQAAEDLNITLD